jgi:hypothetical protein
MNLAPGESSGIAESAGLAATASQFNGSFVDAKRGVPVLRRWSALEKFERQLYGRPIEAA